MLDFPSQGIQNTGRKWAEFDDYQGLADVAFHVYDATAAFTKARENGATRVEGRKSLHVQSQLQASSFFRRTDTHGDLFFIIAQKQGKDAALG